MNQFRNKIDQLEGRLQFGCTQYQAVLTTARKLEAENEEIRQQLQLGNQPTIHTNAISGTGAPAQAFGSAAITVNNITFYNSPHDVNHNQLSPSTQVSAATPRVNSGRVVPAPVAIAAPEIKPPRYRNRDNVHSTVTEQPP
jgi:hypothetical protein